MRYKIFLGLALFLGIAVIILAQFSIPTLFEADGYLHIRMAKFIRQYGLDYDFHWTRYSVFAKDFADKDLLYHILLVPFTFLADIFLGAKLAACAFAIFLYLVFYFVLKRYAQKDFIPLFLISMFLSPDFLEAISRTRPMVLVLALTFFFVHFLIEKRLLYLFCVTAVYTLTHVSAPYLLLFALLVESIRFANEREFCWKALVSVALGLVAGFLTHPNFPHNFLVFYLNGILVPIFSLKWGLELGAEFFPTDTRQLVLGYPLILLGLILLAALGASSENKVKTSTKIWLGITGFFFIFSFFSRRYLIHTYPLMLVALAAYLSDWWQGRPRLWLAREIPAIKVGLWLAGILMLALLGVHTGKTFRQVSLSEMYYNRHYEQVAKFMAQQIPVGEVVFHTNWSDSQYFIGLNPQNDYFVTLDPIYMYAWNTRIYNLYRDIAFGRSPDPYNLLKKVFHADYGYAGKNYFSGLINQIRADSRFAVMAEDNLGLVFRLK